MKKITKIEEIVIEALTNLIKEAEKMKCDEETKKLAIGRGAKKIIELIDNI